MFQVSAIFPVAGYSRHGQHGGYFFRIAPTKANEPTLSSAVNPHKVRVRWDSNTGRFSFQ